jgi:hypothetical protein
VYTPAKGGGRSCAPSKQPYFDGLRDLATNGLAKPVLNAEAQYASLERAGALALVAPPVTFQVKEVPTHG